MDFSGDLLKWYVAERRELPWRCTQDPYKIWIAEIILQQTRVGQGLVYYRKFIRRFPDIQSLAGASITQVMKLWEGLGYYSRAVNLHRAAQQIMKHHRGRFPDTYKEVISLKGIGPYTSAAILSIAFHQVWPVLDGNVARVVARLLAMEELPGLPAGKEKILNFLRRKIDKNDPGNFNQAMMEVGALICRPQNPLCEKCPLATCCKARKQGNVHEYPVKITKMPNHKRFFHYLVILEEKSNWIYIRERTDKDIWRKLFDFPCIEAGKNLNQKQLESSIGWKRILENQNIIDLQRSHPLIHKLTHRDLHLSFIRIYISGKLKGKKDLLRVKTSSLEKYPFPVPLKKYISSFLQELL